VTFRRDSGTLASGENGNGFNDLHQVQLWDSRTGKPDKIFVIEGHVINQIAYSPDGSELAVATSGPVANVYDADTAHRVSQTGNHGFGVTAIAFGTDKDLLLSGDQAGNVEIQTGGHGGWFHSHKTPISAVVALAENSFAAASDGSQEVNLFDDSGNGQGSIIDGPRLGVHSLAVNRNGTKLALGGQSDSGGCVTMYDVMDNSNGGVSVARAWSQQVGGKSVWGLSFEPNGKRIAVVPHDADRPLSVRLLDVATGKEVAQMQQYVGKINSIAFRSDGNVLASGGDDDRSRTTQVKFETAPAFTHAGN
jgi:WD40 repeat protein